MLKKVAFPDLQLGEFMTYVSPTLLNCEVQVYFLFVVVYDVR